MAQYTNYNFSDPDLNYDEVEVSLLQLYSDVSRDIGRNTAPQIPFTEINAQMLNRVYDKDNNPERWKKDVEIAYRLLYNFYL